MGTANTPEGYNNVIPYLIVNNAAGFMNFLKTVFGAEEIMRHMREDGTTIMHGEVRIGNSVIMLAEATEQYTPSPAGMFVYVADADAVYNLALANGATSVLAMNDQPYGRTGGVKDAYGNTWWVTTHKAG